MANKNVSTLGFIRTAIVDNKGIASRDTVKWLQKIETKTNAALTVLGIDPEAPISGTNKTIGGTTQNLSENGTLPTGALEGTVAPGQVGFTLDEVPDGITRFAVGQVDTAHLAIINFADAQHQNKTLDSINDGVTYQRFTRVASGATTLATGAIGSGASAVSTAGAAGVLATDTVIWSFSGGPVSGYAASATGSLIVFAYVLSGSVNFYVANSFLAPITPGAQVVNWLVIR